MQDNVTKHYSIQQPGVNILYIFVLFFFVVGFFLGQHWNATYTSLSHFTEQ